MASRRYRPRTARAAGAVVVVPAALAFALSACSSGESDTECTGGAYEVECHPVRPRPSDTASGPGPPALAAPVPSVSCPTDWAQVWQQVHARTWDFTCPEPSPLPTVVPAPSG